MAVLKALSTSGRFRVSTETPGLAPFSNSRVSMSGVSRSVRTGHVQQMLGDIGQHQVVGDGRGAEYSGFLPLALDVVFGGHAVAAVGGHGGLGGLPRGLGAQ